MAQHTISGQVTSEEDGEPLIGCNILQVGTDSGTVTDVDGKFSLEIDSFPAEIITSYLGFKQQKLVVNNTDFLSISLEVNEEIIGCPIIISYAGYWRHAQPTQQITLSEMTLDDPVSTTSALNRIPGVHMQSGALNTNRLTIRGIGNRNSLD